ncbi:unnamed protein product [Lactuca saligna]|uniref:Ubiquitin-like modifier-activating enzyme Atg7 N-terminal domain-containing protein n=1 Tax=Lactuca saligna TaxID=75948 RepID=A0AA35UXR6_LACSI|nr:unnamed protein product [Lactuca saligna]
MLFGFYDPSHLPNNPGWPLCNFLVFISAEWTLKKIQFLCYHENHGFADLGLSLVGEALIQPSQGGSDKIGLFLLEIGTEELPPNDVATAGQQLKDLIVL